MNEMHESYIDDMKEIQIELNHSELILIVAHLHKNKSMREQEKYCHDLT